MPFGGYSAPCINISTNDPDVAALYEPCLTDLCEQNDAWTVAQTALLGLVGIFSVVRQQLALERQIDLQERSVDQAQCYVDLAKRNYEEVVLSTFEDVTRPAFEDITKPAFDCQKTLFDDYRTDMRQCELDFLEDAKCFPKEYEADYKTVVGRATSGISERIARARRNAARSRGKFATGRCCAEDAWFAIEEAKLKTQAANEAIRYEDNLKRQLDQWYFQRRGAAAELAAAARAHVISGVNGGVAGVNASINAISSGVSSTISSVNSVGGAVGQFGNATSALGGAILNQATAFGALGNGAFQALGYQQGFFGGNQNAGVVNFSGGGFPGNSGTFSGGVFNQPAINQVGFNPNNLVPSQGFQGTIF